jgi:hypothetical protein
MHSRAGSKVRRFVLMLLLALSLGYAAPVTAQSHDEWDLTIAPLDVWIPRISGSLGAARTTVPVFLKFSDIADKLERGYAFHVEGRKKRIGVESDVFFVRLSTDATYQLPFNQSVTGTASLDSTIFEVGGTYLVARAFSIVSGVRTYTLSPTLTLTGPNQSNSVDVSKTNVDGFAGFTFRPPLGKKVVLLSRADIGGGASKLTWRASLGFEYRYRPWGGVTASYSALGIDTRDTAALGSISVVTHYHATHYGPAFALTFRWGR